MKMARLNDPISVSGIVLLTCEIWKKLHTGLQ